LRAKVLEVMQELPRRDRVLFPASEGGRISIDNFRMREWTPALKAAGVDHRRIYDMRHLADARVMRPVWSFGLVRALPVGLLSA
jgi:hypothetical protein